jgi:cyclopropane-fatty-acyl-phospholipid synthase
MPSLLSVIPDFLVRRRIRSLLRLRLRGESAGGPDAVAARRRDLVARLDASPVAVGTDDANAQHYELPPRFFELVLGKRLKYSCALWDGATTLDEAEERMLDLYVERAGLADGQRVLDLGCGWGSLSLFLAERFPRSRILGVSNSRDQKAFVEGRARARGLSNVEVRTADVNGFDPGARFDRVVSIEMFEHMRNVRELFRRIAGWLAPEGKLFVHVFSHREFAYLFEAKDGSDWMAKHFFTGGMMPSRDLLPSLAGSLRCVGTWTVEGSHYAKTADAWLANHDARADEIRALFRDTYGPAASKRFAMWRIFWMACAELWRFDGGRQWGVSHYAFDRGS